MSFYFAGNNKMSLSQEPFFIVGFPRSGTTLLQSLLATQDGVVTFPETHFFDLISSFLVEENGLLTGCEKESFIRALRQYIKLNRDEAEQFFQDVVSGQCSKKELFEKVIRTLLLSSDPGLDISDIHWLEKTPNHIFHISEIHRMYPKARFLFIIRDPLNCFSSYKEVRALWGEEFKPVEIYCDLYRQGVEIYEEFSKRHPDSILLVRFEKLVDDHVAVIRNLCAFLGISFSAETLENFTREAEKIVLPEETWKQSNRYAVSPDIARREGRQGLTDLEKYRVRQRIGEVALKYGYDLGNTKFQPEESAGSFQISEVLDTIAYLKDLAEKLETELRECRVSEGRLQETLRQRIEELTRRHGEELAQKEEELAAAYQRIEELRSRQSEAFSQKEEELAAARQQVEGLMNSHNRIVAQYEKEIALLEQQRNELQKELRSIVGTFSEAEIMRLRILAGRICPSGTRRRRFLDKMLRGEGNRRDKTRN